MDTGSEMFGCAYNGAPWEWRTLGVANPGSGGPWEWRAVTTYIHTYMHVIRSILNTSCNSTKIDELCINGTKITDAEIMAENFNIYLSNVAQILSDKIPTSQKAFDSYMTPPLSSSFALIPTTPEELIFINQSLKLTHSSGADAINLYTRSTSAILNLLVAPLSQIINSSFYTGIVPPALKIARVTPIAYLNMVISLS